MNVGPSSVRAAAQRSRRHVLAVESKPPITTLPPQQRCACGEPMFWDEQTERHLCPARFDGMVTHIGWDTPRS